MTVFPRNTLRAHAMGRDALATLFVGAAVAIYLLAATGTALQTLSTRTLAALIFALGAAACASTGERMAEAFSTKGNPPLVLYAAVASLVGAVALITGVGAIITASEKMLDVLVPSIVALWLLATVRHASATTKE
jgi:hypothetical protein